MASTGWENVMYVTSPADGPNSGQYSARRSEVAVMRPDQYSRDKGYFVFIILHTCCFRALRNRSRVWSCPELDIFGEKDAEAGQIWMSHFHPHHLDSLVQLDLEPGKALQSRDKDSSKIICWGYYIINQVAWSTFAIHDTS